MAHRVAPGKPGLRPTGIPRAAVPERGMLCRLTNVAYAGVAASFAERPRTRVGSTIVQLGSTWVNTMTATKAAKTKSKESKRSKKSKKSKSREAGETALRILDGLSSPVLLIDRSFTIVAANQASKQQMRHAARDIVGSHCFRVTHGLDEPCGKSGEIDCPLSLALESGGAVRSIHKHQIEGRLIVEELIATPLREDDGEIRYIIEEFRDVTKLLDLREGMLPICAGCKKIRDIDGNWQSPEVYFRDRTGADFSHALCEACLEERHPELG